MGDFGEVLGGEGEGEEGQKDGGVCGKSNVGMAGKKVGGYLIFGSVRCSL